jgi:hypothetical protein
MIEARAKNRLEKSEVPGKRGWVGIAAPGEIH